MDRIHQKGLFYQFSLRKLRFLYCRTLNLMPPIVLLSSMVVNCKFGILYLKKFPPSDERTGAIFRDREDSPNFSSGA